MGYRIKSGDALSRIASVNKTTVSALMKANPQIKNANNILAGATLKLPGQSDGFEDAPIKRSGAGSTKSSDKSSTFDAPAAGSSSSGVKGPKGNPYEIANQHKGKNAGALKLEKKGVGADMDDGVGNKVNCANFVSACLEQAGMITDRQHSNLVSGLQNNLDKDKNFKRVSLQDAKKGDVVSMKTGPGAEDRHVVIFAGWKNGKPEFIGSNNRNKDGTQKITTGPANYPILSIHQYRG
ncbi:LysM peptidoglycan-binding domain-containing protein [Corallococcus exiguus]|uniref:LysM peptidoglycan-binding domain-containing protein n=1 Tax=Corallococcus exiguus TaxID=83462 RepID=UPI003DA2AE3E